MDPLKSMVKFAGGLGFISLHSWADGSLKAPESLQIGGVSALLCTQIGVSEHYLEHLRRHLT